MKTPDNPELLVKFQRYKTASAEYRTAREAFKKARKELKFSRIDMLRAKKGEAHKNLRKKSEIPGPCA